MPDFTRVCSSKRPNDAERATSIIGGINVRCYESMSWSCRAPKKLRAWCRRSYQSDTSIHTRSTVLMGLWTVNSRKEHFVPLTTSEDARHEPPPPPLRAVYIAVSAIFLVHLVILFRFACVVLSFFLKTKRWD